MDELRPLLVRMRIAALQSEVRSKDAGETLLVRSRRNKVTHVPNAAGSHCLGKKRVVLARKW
ncbi:hypothetical protein K4F52_006532 [Lecanicillium sp. MT-2017a]|nr:hypothetical protein K4F52_006532 [Lecanicillium sp. MT-2017a]